MYHVQDNYIKLQVLFLIKVKKEKNEKARARVSPSDLICVSNISMSQIANAIAAISCRQFQSNHGIRQFTILQRVYTRSRMFL